MPDFPSVYPDRIADVSELEDMLSEPTNDVVATLKNMKGDIIVLGAAGKMGPTLTRMAKRASDAAGVERRIIGVSLFFSERDESVLQESGIETVTCDLLDPDQIRKLPDAPNVIFMAGMKFGATGNEPLTWATNTALAGLICPRYSSSRIVVFSSANVYGFSDVTHGGSVESDPPNPEGEYAMSVLGRERISEYCSAQLGTPTAIMRLSYAVEMRYGVLVDVASKVWAEEPVDLTTGNAHVIWQQDANAMALLLLNHASSPAFVLNVTGPEMVSIRSAAQQFGELMGKPVSFTGCESPKALLCNAQLSRKLLGDPRVSVGQMIRWIADWVMRGGEDLGKPTHFEARDGKF